MRDGSLDDVVAVWMERVVEEHVGRTPGESDALVYFTILKAAAEGLLHAHAQWKTPTDYRDLVGQMLAIVHDGLGAQEQGDEVESEWPEPAFETLQAEPEGPAQPPEGKHARYWDSHSWRKDFYTMFSRWFWDMKDYAIPAGRRKMDFLWDVGEVWIATGASALVQYAKDDPPRWKAVADMMRECADLVEKDGLRSLPWGRWGRYSPANHEPKA
jgi:hypothetical protein